MENSEWKEIIVFIHGITPDPDPKAHTENYQSLYQNIQKKLEQTRKPNRPAFRLDPIQVEWGWQSNLHPITNDEYLATAELALSRQAFPLDAEGRNADPTLNPFRLLRPTVRRLLFYGFADLMYYVSRDGEMAVRNHVFRYIVDQVCARGFMDSPANLSLTFITHSAGTIIAHDLLYHLFRGPEHPSEVREVNEVLRELIYRNRLRIRRLYTMGSPLTPLMFRSDSLINKMRERQTLSPQSLGFLPFKDLAGPRWINIWDKDDMAAYPVSFLYQNENRLIEDKYIDVSDLLTAAHNAYWRSPAVAQYIAKTI